MNGLIDDGDRLGKPFEVVVLVKSRQRTSQRIRQRRQISPENSLASSKEYSSELANLVGSDIFNFVDLRSEEFIGKKKSSFRFN